MPRRTSKNKTGISQIDNNTWHDAWISYVCINCDSQNKIHLWNQLLNPGVAFNNQSWKCSKCGFIHSKNSSLPAYENWEQKYTEFWFLTVERFWMWFFRQYTEKPDVYWKQCTTCAKVLPFNAFAKHSNWWPLERQLECRMCKWSINAILNPLRTKEQLHESSSNRRIWDLLLEWENENIDIESLFVRFWSKCFKTWEVLDINDRSSWQIDHILASAYLYPLTISNAALLSTEANANKKAKWPSDFYTNNELIELAKITWGNLDLFSSKEPIINPNIDVNRCVHRFLKVREHSDLQKRVKELKKLLKKHNLIEQLDDDNKSFLWL